MEIATSTGIPTTVATKVEASEVSRLEVVCSQIIEKTLFAIVFLIPLAMDNFTEEWFSLPKATALRILTTVAIGAWLAKGVSSGRFLAAKTWLDIPIFAYLFLNLIASLTSVSPALSLIGTVFRQDGLFTLVNWVLLFYLVVTNMRREDRILRIIQIEVLAGIPVAALGVAQHFGSVILNIDPNYFGDSRVFSTIGNPGFLGGYLVILLPLGLVLATNSRSIPGRGLWVATMVLMGVCLVYTYTRGAWIGAGVTALVFVFLSKRNLLRALPWLAIAALLVVVSLLLEQQGLFDSFKVPVQGSGGDEAGGADVSGTLNRIVDASGGTGEIRLQMWRGALGIIRDHPILGTGPNSFLPMYSRYAPVEYTRGEGLDRFPDKPHNVYLEVAVNSGVLGLVAFLSILAIFGLKALLWVWKAEGSHGLLGAGLLSSWAGFLAYLFFLFFVVDTGTLFWLNSALLLGLMGIGEARYEVHLTLSQTLRPVGYLATLALGAFLIYLSLRPFMADIYMKQMREYLGNLHAEGSKEGLEDRLKSARRLADSAIHLNPYEISYYTKVAGIIDVERGMKSDPEEVRGKLDEAIVYYSMAIQRNPKMASLYYLRGAGYEAYGDDHLRDAMADFETSVELYPYYYNGNTGLASVAQRLGMRSEEVVAERRLAELFPHYPSNLINLASALYAMGRNQEAITELEKVLKFEPANAEVHYSLGQVYATIGNKERAVAEYGKALEIDPKMTSAQKAVDILEGQVDQSDSNKPKGYH